MVMMRAVFIVVPWSTSGSQKCTGASPSLVARAIVSRMVAVGSVICVMSHVPVCHALVVLENSSIADAAACVRKYFVAASVARGWCCFEIIGIMARVFISRPIQAIIQW